MRFAAEIKDLKKAIAFVKKALPKGDSWPGASGIKVAVTDEVVKLTATNGSLTIEKSLDGGIEDGASVVPARPFADLLAVTSGRIVVAAEGKEIVVSDGLGTWRMERYLDDEEFPTTPVPPKRLARLDESFPTAVAQVVPATGTDAFRPILSGVLIEAEGDGMRLVATDSYRLAVRDLPGPSPKQPVLVSASALHLLTKAVQVRYGVASGWASFDTDLGLISTRLIEGDFPKYRQFYNEFGPEPTTTVDRQSLLDAIARTRPFHTEISPVRLSLGPEPEVAIDSPLGRTRTPLAVEPPAKVPDTYFNPRFLREGASLCGDAVEMTVTDAVKPALLRSGDFRYLLMPIRNPSR
jgi:DNA polymerase-3 subunit beta